MKKEMEKRESPEGGEFRYNIQVKHKSYLDKLDERKGKQDLRVYFQNINTLKLGNI